MLKYFLNRVLQLIPVILGVTLLVFLIMQMASGDPARLILGELATQGLVELGYRSMVVLDREGLYDLINLEG